MAKDFIYKVTILILSVWTLYDCWLVLANAVGVSRQTIIAIENDKYNPTLELAMKIAKLLNLHVDEIFFLDE